VKKRRVRILATFASIAVAAGAFLAWYAHAETLRIEIHPVEIALASLPSALDGYRITLISCIHTRGFGQREEMLRRILLHDPSDLLVIAGDFRFKEADPEAAIGSIGRILDGVRLPDGIVAVQGNHDTREIVEAVRRMGVRLPINEGMEIRTRGTSLWIAGSGDPIAHVVDLDAALAGRPPLAFTILVAHSPDVVYEARKRGIPLVLAGHTHGGQICFPWIGPVVTETRIVGRRFARGLVREDGTAIYITRGIGWTALPFRLLARPEVTRITLRRGPAATPGGGFQEADPGRR
jgi:uncharacterized protein